MRHPRPRRPRRQPAPPPASPPEPVVPLFPRATNALVAAGASYLFANAISGGQLAASGGILLPAALADGALVMLLTPTLAHADLPHAIVTLLLLLAAGPTAERLLGRARLLAAYFAGGAGALLASAVFLPAEAAVGASGAVLGVVGALFGLVLLRPGIVPEGFERRLTLLLAAGVLLEVLMGVFVELVNNALHVGGLLAGFLLGGLLRPRAAARPRTGVRVASGALLALLAVLLALEVRPRARRTLAWAVQAAGEAAGEAGTGRDAAIEILERGLREAGDGSADRLALPLAQNNLAWLYVEAGRNLERALELSEESNRVALGGRDRAALRNPAFLDTLGYLYALSGRCREAADVMGQAADLDPALTARRDEVRAACAEGRRPDPAVAQATPSPTPTPATRRGIRI